MATLPGTSSGDVEETVALLPVIPRSNAGLPLPNDATKPVLSAKEEAQFNLQSAKDRAQITASTSMSIVHVVLLKQVLDAGTEGNPYYYFGLTLISVALTLQVICGFFALYVAFLRRYFRKYKNNMRDEFCDILCPWSCKKKKNDQEFDIKEFLKLDLTGSKVKPKSDGSSDICSCIPWKCVDRNFQYKGYNILELEEELAHMLLAVEAQTAGYEDEINKINEEIKSTRDKLSGDPNNKALNYTLLEKENKIKEVVKEHREVGILKARSKVLKEYIEELHEDIVMKQAEFWQYILNLLLYVIFVLNAFIAAFGFATHHDGSGNGHNSTVTNLFG